MAPKRKEKTKHSEWLQCSLCGKLFAPVDAEAHASSCDADHGYVQRKVLHGKVMNVEGILLKDGSPLMKTVRDYNSVAWLAIPTMQICGLSIGQPCVINKMVIKRAWPAPALSVSGVAMTANSMLELNVQKGDTLTVERFVSTGAVASAAELTLQEENQLFKTSEFCGFVSSYLDGKYIRVGTPLIIHYFGQLCHCQVSSIYHQVKAECQSPKHPADQNCSTPSKRPDQNIVHESTCDQNQLNAEDLLPGDCDASFVSSQDISLSMGSLNISNTSFNDSVANTPGSVINTPGSVINTPGSVANTPSISHKFPNIVSPCQVATSEDALENSTAELSFCLVSSSATKFTVTTKDLISQTDNTDSIISLKDLGGLTNQITEIKARILRARETDNASCCILVHGPPGTGKTVLVQALSNDLAMSTFHVAGTDLWSKLFGEAEANLRKIFSMAQDRAPSTIVIDNFDVVCPKRSSNTAGQQEHRIVGTLISLIDNLTLKKSSAPVVVVGITNKKDDLDPALRRAGRFGCEVEVGVPTSDQRLEILQAMLNKVPYDLTKDQLETVARNAHGYVGADMSALINEALLLASRRMDPDSPLFKVTFDDLVAAGSHIKPSALREIQLEVAQVRWSDIGGMSEVKMRLQEAVVLPLTNPEVFRRLGISPPKGLLMYGPPGCSKTMVARALATECKFNFLAVKGPELFNQYVGESEKAVREVFRKARSAAPAIIFFDEIDAIAGRRGSSSGGSGVDDRVLTQLLTEMDGLEFLKDVFIMAATNRPDKIDHALLRPGRFDSLVYVPLPDDATRREILDKKLSKMSTSEDVSIEGLVELTEDYSGAEVIQVCQEAALCALREDLETKHVQKRHFDSALKKITPQIDSELLQIYLKFSHSRLK